MWSLLWNVRFSCQSWLLRLVLALSVSHALSRPLLAEAIPGLPEGIKVDLAAHIEFVEDKTSALTLDQVRNPEISSQFKPSGPKAPNFGFSESTYWMRFRMADEWLKGKEPLALVFGYALIDDLRIYIPTETGSYVEMEGGRHREFGARPLPVHFLNFILPESNVYTGQYIYVRGKTSSSHQYPLELYSLHEFQNKYQEDSLGSRIYMGAIAIMALYNAIFFLMTLDLVYLVYVTFILVSGSQVLSVQGFSYQFLWPHAVGFNAVSVPFLMCGSVWLMCLFSLQSLDRLRNHRYLSLAIKLHVALGLAGCAAALVLSYKSSIKIAVILTLTSSLTAIVAYLRLSLNRYRPAYFFLISIGALLGASIVYSLKAVGVLPYNFFTENAPLIGSALQISLLTFGLADRFRELKAQHALMQAQMIELQKENIRKLDEQVAEKTADIRSILKTINQGIFTVSGALTIDAEKSDALTQMFPDTANDQSDPIKAIFAQSQLTTDALDQIHAAFTAALDSDALNFELNSACFPRDFQIQGSNGQTHYFECDWTPILDQGETVKKILVAVRDTTELKKLEEVAKQREAEMGSIMEILAIPSQKFTKAYKAIHRLVQQVRAIASQDKISGREWQQLYALLHTAKGNSRTFGLKRIANQIHELEELVKHLAESQAPGTGTEFREGLDQLESYIQELGQLAEEKLGRSLSDHHLSMASDDWSRLIKSLEDLENMSPTSKVSQEVEQMRERLLHLRFPHFADLVHELSGSLERAAHQLHKPVPAVLVEDSVGLYLRNETSEALQSAFVHLLTNSLDHGIETPEERVRKGKGEQGTIRLQVQWADAQTVEIRLGDDGAGLNLGVLAQLAQKKNLPHAHSQDPRLIAETIFASGVSTHDKVSDLSGRGVGMDAVRELLQQLGGSIQIAFNHEKPDITGKEPFQFVLKIPLEHFWLSKQRRGDNPSLAKVS